MKKSLIHFSLVLLTYVSYAQCDTDDVYNVEDANAVCIEVVDNARIIYSNNYPDHDDNYNQPQFTVTAGDYEYGMCAYPEEANDFTPLYEEVETTVGCTYTYTFGVSINGVKYDPNSAVTFVNDDESNNLDWHVEATSTANNIGQNMGTDNGGHLNPFGEYHYHAVPTNYFVNDLGIDGSSHSPIVGYAADGFPIYYKYVYSDPDDDESSITAASSGYSLRSGDRPGDGLTAPDGTYDGNYYEDYEYNAASTILDECNGRNGVTPDFPFGTYYYVITDQYPYIPRCFKGSVLDDTFRVGPSAACGESSAADDCAPVVQGCMDPFAENYNPDANYSDGSCIYCTPPNAPTVSGGGTYCDGDDISDLSVTGSGGTFTWYDDAELTNEVGNGNSFSPVQMIGSTTYYVTETSSECESDASSVIVTINALPSVAIDATTTSICAGDAVTLSGTGAETYLWDNSVANGESFTPSTTTTYTVIGTDENGCENTAEVTITVTSTPSAPAVAGGATYCEGETISDLTVSGSGGTFTWYDDEALSNMVGNGSSFSPSSTVGSNTYYVTESNGDCESVASSATVTINEVPVIEITASSNSICEGDEVTLSATGADMLEWDNNISNGVAFTPTGTTTYTVTGTNASGCDNTEEITVVVNSVPDQPTITLSTATNQLTSSSAEGNQWFFNGNIITGATFQTYTADENGTYTVQVTLNGCVSAFSDETTVDHILGLAEVAESFKLWPNPVIDHIIVELDHPEQYSYEIIQMNGQQIMAGSLSYRLDLNNLQNGYYLLMIKNEEGSFMKKFIKR